MLLTEIASLINIGANNQLTADQIAIYVDAAQKSVYQTNLQAFLVYDQKVSIQQVLNVSSFEYDPIDSDIGKAVVGGTSSASGILVSYDASTLNVVTTDTYTAGESFTITSGTGSGVIDTPTGQAVFKGPYQAPANTRKVLGITTRKPGRFDIQFAGFCAIYAINGNVYTGDYGLIWDNGRPFETGLVGDLQNTFFWATPPSLKATYYWTYWKQPPTISGLDDDSSLTIPTAYHLEFANFVKAWAKVFLEDAPQPQVSDYLGKWITDLEAPYRDQKGYQNQTQNSGFPSGLI